MIDAPAPGPSEPLRGRTALVTGASRGIGRGIAGGLLAAGASVVAIARSRDALEQAAAELDAERCVPVAADVTDLDQLVGAATTARERFGGLDILCHNAGSYPIDPIEEMSVEAWDEVLRTNLTSAFLAVKACLPGLRESSYGRVVLISSITGPRTGYPGLAHYGAAKAGMLGFMRTAALELAPSGITVNAIEPGSIETESQGELVGADADHRLRAIPLGHRGKPGDIAAAVVFLASDGARFLTGESLAIDGGQLLPEYPQ